MFPPTLAASVKLPGHAVGMPTLGAKWPLEQPTLKLPMVCVPVPRPHPVPRPDWE